MVGEYVLPEGKKLLLRHQFYIWFNFFPSHLKGTHFKRTVLTSIEFVTWGIVVDYYLSNALRLFLFVYVSVCFMLLFKEPLGCLCCILCVGKGGSGVKKTFVTSSSSEYIPKENNAELMVFLCACRISKMFLLFVKSLDSCCNYGDAGGRLRNEKCIYDVLISGSVVCNSRFAVYVLIFFKNKVSNFLT